MEGFKKIKSIILLVVVVALIGCFAFLKIQQTREKKLAANNQNQNNIQNNSDSPIQLGSSGELKKFASYDEAKQFLAQQQQNNNYSLPMMTKGLAMDTVQSSERGSAVASAPVADGLGAGPAAGSAGNDFSKTNVQVEGVDEADIVKTDGNYIYATSYNNLFIIKAYPGEQAEIVSKIEFKSRPTDLYINGDNLAVFGYDDRIYTMDLYKSFRRQNSYTFFKVFDISDKKNPKQVRDLDFEGNYFNSRMIGDYVYFITNNYNYFIGPEPVVPRILDGGVALDEKCSGANVKCFNPSIYYFDIPYDSYNFTTISAINIKDNNAPIKGDVYMLSSAQNMYVSPNNLYITYTKYISEYELEMAVAREILLPRLSETDRALVAKIEAVTNDILTESEKKSKVQQILNRYLNSLSVADQESYEKELAAKMKQKYTDLAKEMEKTIVYKIAISGDTLTYKAKGEVTGSVLNQFAMDEANGYFRIATTKNTTWSRFEGGEQASYNNVYVLDGDMKLSGAAENIAPGERIYSVRFMGNRAYVVTFKQVDPLFALDMSDPKSPKVLGQLKVPGFSTYLHPYDANTLIGFGKDAGENEYGNTIAKGLKVSLFDVTDVTAPKELDTYLMGDMGSDSAALYDHKAFLFSYDKNLLVLPVMLRKSTAANQWGDISFSGAMVFNLKDKKIQYTGKIDHSDGGQPANQDYWDGYSYYDNSVKRSLYIQNQLYTLSNNYLKINDLGSLTEIKKLELKKDSGSDFKVVN